VASECCGLVNGLLREAEITLLKFETTVVSNFLGRGDPCTRGSESETSRTTFRSQVLVEGTDT
jgi:hypothetical protein